MLRLADLRNRISCGAYVVEPALIADAMLRRLHACAAPADLGPEAPQTGCS